MNYHHELARLQKEVKDAWEQTSDMSPKEGITPTELSNKILVVFSPEFEKHLREMDKLVRHDAFKSVLTVVNL